MNKVLNIIFVAAAVACVYAAVGIYPAEKKPPAFADQEGCYLSKFNAVLPLNKPFYPRDGHCEQYTCQTNGDTQVVTCGALRFPDNCRLEKDLTLDYPDCCGTVVCDPTTESPVTTEAPPTTGGSCVTTEAPPTTEGSC